MSDFVRIVNASREYALEQKEAIVKKYQNGGMWSLGDTSDHDYYEGQVDALERALMAYQQTHKQDWSDGYTSALANAREAGYIDEDQYEDLYTEVE